MYKVEFKKHPLVERATALHPSTCLTPGIGGSRVYRPLEDSYIYPFYGCTGKSSCWQDQWWEGMIYSKEATAQQSVTRFAGPTKSGPLALNADDTLLAVVNPDVNTVTLFDVGADRNLPLGEIPVGPNRTEWSFRRMASLCMSPIRWTARCSVLQVDPTQQPVANVVATLQVGTEPYGIALTPNGQKAYVTNARSNSVSVIDTASNTWSRRSPTSARRWGQSRAASPSPTTATTVIPTKRCISRIFIRLRTRASSTVKTTAKPGW